MITKNYIKMCEKAEEIQKEWEQAIGDMFIYERDIETGCYYYITEHKKYRDAIWLPTQEQLQEMVIKQYTPFAKVMKFSEFVLYHSGLNPYAENSINELWLMYVMKERYNKVWNGKEWNNGK